MAQAKLKARQNAYNTHYTIAINKLETEVTSHNPKLENIRKLIEQAELKLKVVEENSSKLQDALDVEDIGAEIEKVSNFQDRMVDMKIQGQMLIESSIKKEKLDETLSLQVKKQKVKLPTLKVKQFSGDYEEFVEFIDSFTAIVDNNDSLEAVEKFLYLKDFVKGEALTLIEGLSISNANYETALNLIKKTFGRKDLIIGAHVSKLLNLEKQGEDKQQHKTLRNLYNKIQSQVRALEAMGITAADYSIFLVPIVLSKLSYQVNVNWSKKREEVHIDRLLEFLEIEVEGQEDAVNRRAAFSSTEESRPNSVSRNKNYNSSYRQATAASLHTNTDSNYKLYCGFCKDTSHIIESCKELKKLSAEEVRLFLIRENRCLCCLKKGHRIAECYKLPKLKCSVCQGKHNTLIHWGNRDEKNMAGNDTEKDEDIDSDAESTASTIHVQTKSKGKAALFQTAKAILKNDDGQQTLVNIVLDGASDKSYIRENTSRKVKMKHHTENLAISSWNAQKDQSKSRIIRHATIVSRHDPHKSFKLELIETDVICTALKREPLPDNILHTKYLKGLQLANDYSVSDDGEIDILIGLDFYWDIVTGKVSRQKNKPVAMETSLGWILSGRLDAALPSTNSTTMCCFTSSGETSIQNNIKKLWDVESIYILPDKSSTSEDAEALQKFQSSLSKRSKKYYVGLPKKDETQIANNLEVATKRLKNLKGRFKASHEFEEKYRNAMEEYINEGYAEQVEKESNGHETYYMPHQAVIKEDKETTKFRLVFDASSKKKEEKSLNDILHTGPQLLPLLTDIIMRFRLKKIAVTADIRKMYLMIGINPDDRNLLRFLYQPRNAEVQHYRHTVLPFGVSSSPYLAISVIHHHLKPYEEKYPTAFKALNEDMYMDDLLTSVDTEEEAIKLGKDSYNVMKEGGMKLTKWKSNSPRVTKCIKSLEDEEKKSKIKVKQIKSPSVKEVKIPEEHPVSCERSSHKVLGLHWVPENDKFTFKFDNLLQHINDTRVTKRLIFSIGPKTYDPMGWIAPFITTLKIIIKKVWESGVQWDEKVPQKIELAWKAWIEDMRYADQVFIPRCYSEGRDAVAQELHIFGDSSESAYGAVVYLRTEDENKGITVNIVFAKGKIAPVKRITLPRLELLAALLAARIGKNIKKALKLPSIATTYWTDSNIALHWICSDAQRWKSWVYNRVSEIQNDTEPREWNKCSGKENPADIISRGMTLKQLVNSTMWLKGPTWLSKPKEEWPVQNIGVPKKANYETEQKPVCLINKTHTSSCIDPKNNSKWRKLIGVTARIKRMFYNAQRKNESKKIGELTVQELDEASTYWLKVIQSNAFSEEIEALKLNEEISSKSTLQQLNPYLDKSDGIIRMTGRVQFSQLEEGQKHPIILPYNHPAVRLLIKHIHEQQLHAQVSHSLATLRNKYWIIKGRRFVREVIRSCLVCIKSKHKPLTAKMAPLPADRINKQYPFQVVGIDFTGPLYVYQNKNKRSKPQKMYICLYTCAVTRGVHLDLVLNLTTASFMRSFRRFIARRGLCNTIYTDNAKTFKKAHKDIDKNLDLFNNQTFRQHLTNLNIKWKYIQARAPWWGGFYESLMDSLKKPLKKILKNSLLTIDEVSTILVEVEGMLNSRPLTYISEDPEDINYITPAQFLIGRQSFIFPVEAAVERSKSLQESLQLQNKYLDQIWKEWSNKYLCYLGIKNPVRKETKLQLGQLIQVLDHKIPRAVWKVGIIEELMEGKDGVVRRALVRTTERTMWRSVQHLSLLEASESTTDISEMFNQLIANVSEESDFEEEFLKFHSGGDVLEMNLGNT